MEKNTSKILGKFSFLHGWLGCI